MGWFSSSKPEVSAVTRQDRKQCWESRDLYFECLDRVAVLEAGKEGSACAKENSRYEENCAKSWIEYFNKRRILAEQQKDLLAQSKVQAQEAKRR
ncbi:cytochrome oxidase c subunit VIb-domain-containing protein [Melanogaster broomeanus]|nr:cytochrome oxidase c subunit VIb-domain-containing protein [Melanogaster broomeanus]KAF9230996.1 cytochrome oxidase c subunit VIb-domain-containing protein [Melanogaster broomeanus]